MLFGEPLELEVRRNPAREFDDEGRTVLMPFPFAFWLKRDDCPPDCDPAIREGGAVYTYMLPEDY